MVFAVFKGSELEGSGIQDCTGDRTVGPSSARAFAIAVFVRLARHCEVYSDVTGHANKELGTGSVNLCPFLTASARELIIHCPSNLAMGFHDVHVQSAFSVSEHRSSMG